MQLLLIAIAGLLLVGGISGDDQPIIESEIMHCYRQGYTKFGYLGTYEMMSTAFIPDGDVYRLEKDIRYCLNVQAGRLKTLNHCQRWYEPTPPRCPMPYCALRNNTVRFEQSRLEVRMLPEPAYMRALMCFNQGHPGQDESHDIMPIDMSVCERAQKADPQNATMVMEWFAYVE